MNATAAQHISFCTYATCIASINPRGEISTYAQKWNISIERECVEREVLAFYSLILLHCNISLFELCPINVSYSHTQSRPFFRYYPFILQERHNSSFYSSKIQKPPVSCITSMSPNSVVLKMALKVVQEASPSPAPSLFLD